MRRRVPRLLRVNRPFRHFWAGQTISLFGDQIALLALPLLAVLTLRADAQEMGLLAALEMIPSLLFAIHLGAWADRRRSRRALLIGTDLGRAVLLLGIPVASALGVLTMPILYVVAFAVGSLGVLFTVSEQTVFTSMVRPNDYVEANSLLIGSRSVTLVGGKSLGGLLVAALTAPVAIGIDALSFLASAFFVGRDKVSEPPVDPDPGSLADGARFLRDTPLLRATLLGCVTLNVFTAAIWALVVLYATTELGLGSGAIGIALGVGALGSVLGAAIARGLIARLGLGRVLIGAFVLASVPLSLIPLASGPRGVSVLLLTLAEFGAGIGVMVLEVGLFSLQAAVIPDRLRSRVWGAILFANWGLRPLGALGGGFLAAAIGLRPTLWIAAVGSFAGVLWLLPSPLAQVRDVSDDGLVGTRQPSPVATAVEGPLP